MKVAELPGKLPPGMQLFPPLVSQTLGATPEGLETGLPQIGHVGFDHLAAVSVCTVPEQGAEVPLLLLFIGGQRRPVAVQAIRIKAAALGLEGAPHRPEKLRKLLLLLLRQAPHAIIDSATLEFLQGRMLRSRGDRLSDLADAVGLALVNGTGIKDVDVQGIGTPAPPPVQEAPPPPPAQQAPPPMASQASLWVHPEYQALVVFVPGAVFLAGRGPDENAALARHLAAGTDPRQILKGRAFEIPNAAFVHVRRSRETKRVELEYRSSAGVSKTAVPYGHEAAGQELFETLRRHLSVPSSAREAT